MKEYLKRVAKAVLNKRPMTYSMQKEYVIVTSEKGRFSGKTALVTGASGAIGGAIAYRLAYEGATVFLGGRNREKLSAMCEEMAQKGLSAHPCEMNVTDPDSVEKAVELVVQTEGKMDILVNCAGGSTRGQCRCLADQSVEMIDEMLTVNLRGSMLCTRAAAKHMRQAKYGRIVNISSVIGEHGKPKFSDYAASKAGVIGYTKSVAQELGQYGVTVNCVSPGFIQRDEFSEAALPYLLGSNFMNRVGSAEDVASAVAYIAADEACFITGQNLCVDGGRSLGLHGD